MIYGYIRVSTDRQTVENQRFEINEFCKKQFGIDLEKHLEIIVIGIVLVTTAPVLIKLISPKKKPAANKL